MISSSKPMDLLIVGAGPAGLATAVFARRHGLSATVIDRRRPADKACGEGIMPGGVELLGELGVRLPPERVRPFRGIRFVDGKATVEGRFSGSPGLGVRRTALSSALIDCAEAAGVELRFDTELRQWREEGGGVVASTSTGELRGRWLIGADGLHSRVRRLAGLERPRPTARRFGVRRHFRVEPWSDLVEVHWSDDAEAYVTPVGAAEVGVAVLWNGDGRKFEALLDLFPTLRERLAAAEPISEASGAGPFDRLVTARTSGRVGLVGDAAGFIDPLTGEGITLALRAARHLAGTIAAGGSLRTYERAHRRMFREYALLTRPMLFVASRPRVRARFVATLARNPGLFDRLVDVNSCCRPMSSVGLLGALRLASALLPVAG